MLIRNLINFFNIINTRLFLEGDFMEKLYDFSKNIDDEKINEISSKIKNGKIIVFPTETVYGIGANALDEKAVNKIFKIKQRPSDNPLIVHVCDKEMIYRIAKNITEIEDKLIDNFMPGPFTIILEKKDIIPNNVTCSMPTVGVRMPNNEIARTIIERCNTPIAAPSANLSGKPSGTNIKDIMNELGNKVDYVIDGGDCDIGIESTVVRVIDDEAVIFRPGKITKEDIERLGIKARLDEHTFKKTFNDEKVQSPGMKYRHYSPNAKTILIYYENESDTLKEIKNVVLESNINTSEICIIGFSEHKNEILNYTKSFNKLKYVDIGSKYNILEISKNIYSALRKSDKYNSKLCIIEGIRKEGIGIGVMNRLYRASSMYIGD